MSLISIKMFPASYGDSFLVTCQGETNTKNTNILIDMGFMSTYNKAIKKELNNLNSLGEKISLLVFTHIDDDHILGGVKFFEENGKCDTPNIISIQEVWHNSYRHLQFDKKMNTSDNESQNDEDIQILNNIISKGYIREKGKNETNTISYLKGSTLSGLLYKNGYLSIWNKSFSNKAVALEDNRPFPTIFINEEVKITLLSPDIEKLTKLDLEWKEKLIELGFSEKVDSSDIMDDAFEIYNSGITVKGKKKRVISQISGDSINIEELAKKKYDPDTSTVNGSSICFILEFKGKKILFLGDSHSDIIEKNLKKLLETTGSKRLHFDAVKISHHGSKHNTSHELLDLIETEKFIISTNGKGRGFTHPDLETLSRIITSNSNIKKELIFNFKPTHLYKHIEDQELKDRYNYKITYSNDASMSILNEITTIVL